MPTQSTVGQARSAGSCKCLPDKARKLARAEPRSVLRAGQLGAHERPGGQVGSAGSLRGGTEAQLLLITGQVCRREMTLRNSLPDIFLMPGFAFTPQRKLLGPQQ